MYKVVSFHLIKFQIILLESVSEVLAGLGEASEAGSAGGRVRACRLLTPSNEGRIRSLQRQ